MTYFSMSPSPRDHEIYNFGRPYIYHNFYIHNLSDPCPGVDEKRTRNIALSLYDMAQHKNPIPQGHDIFNFGRPYYILTLSDLGLEVERKILKEIMFFHTMPFMATPLLINPWS